MEDDQSIIQQGQELYVAGETPPSSSGVNQQIPTPDRSGLTPPPSVPPSISVQHGGSNKSKIFLFVFIFIIIIVVIAVFLLKFLNIGQSSVAELTPTPTPENVDLTYWILWENDKVYQPLIEDFKKEYPYISITVIPQTRVDYRERLENSILEGEGPDIFRFHNTWLPMLLKNQVIASVSDDILSVEEFKKTFYPVAEKDLVKDNKIYGIPLTFDALGLYYNKKMFKEINADPPQSWQDLGELVLELSKPDPNGGLKVAGIAMGTVKNVEFWSDILGMIIHFSGGSILNPDAETTAEAFMFYDLFSQEPGKVWDSQLGNSIDAFASEKVAMIFAPSWVAHQIHAINPDLDFAVIAPPKLVGENEETVQTGWATYWVEGVSSKSKYKRESFLFLKFLTEKENMIKLFTEQSKQDKNRLFGEPYSRKDLAESLKNNQYLKGIVEQGNYAQSGYLSSRTFDNGLNDRIIKYYENAMNRIHNGASSASEIPTLKTGIKDILLEFNITSNR